jgi:hypothetical protein
MEKNSELYQHIIQEMNKENMKKTSGIVFLKTGDVLKIRNYFIVFLDYWTRYIGAMSSGDEELMNQVNKEMNGGVISNGDIAIDLSDVSAMMANPKEKYQPVEFQEED